MGLWNTVIMYPFVRTLEEAEKTHAILAKAGLVRHHFQGKEDYQKGLQIYCMAEIPSNIRLTFGPDFLMAPNNKMIPAVVSNMLR